MAAVPARSLMRKQAFDDKLAHLETLRSAPEEEAAKELRRALKDRSNYLVSKAAALAADRQLRCLVSDLLDAFERCLRDPGKSDPQCWAKIAIAKALKDLGHASPGVFLTGLAHVQLEGVWGGREDSAAPLRSSCATALLNCDIAVFDLLTHLTDLLSDPEASVRGDGARAMGQLGAREGLLPLRLKATMGDAAPEVTGHCFAAMLSIAPRDSLPLVARFLDDQNPDVRIEAVAALVDATDPDGIAFVKKFWKRQSDREVKKTVLAVLPGSPHAEAFEFLLTVIASESSDVALSALQSASKSRSASHHKERVREIVAITESAALMSGLEEWFR